MRPDGVSWLPMRELYHTQLLKGNSEMNLRVFNNGKVMIDLDEVRLIVGSAVLFKNDPKLYDIGDEAANAVRELFNPVSREPQPTPRDKSQES